MTLEVGLPKSAACSRCDTTEKIEKHHVIWRINGGTDDNENLVILCIACHDYQHAKEYLLTSIKYEKQESRITMFNYRLEVLEKLNTIDLIRLHGFRSYWTDLTTHDMPLRLSKRKQRVFEISPQIKMEIR